MFDWKRFLSHNHIAFVTSGVNVSRGGIAVKCPFCGEADPSEHMVIRLRGDGWACWRNRAHRGRSRSRLIQALLRCSGEEAGRLAGEEVEAPVVDEDFSGQVLAAMGEHVSRTPESLQVLEFPKEIKYLVNGSELSLSFLDYIRNRGYDRYELGWLVSTYNLHYSVRGDFAYRLIIPVTDVQGRLQTWVGRSIVDDPLRYRNLSPNALYGPKARASDKSLLLNLPLLWNCDNPKLLVLCEGPFDAMRVSTLGHNLGVYGTCCFGLNASSAQARLFNDLRMRFDYAALLFDADADLVTFRISEALGGDVKSLRLPADLKDPAEIEDVLVLRGWLDQFTRGECNGRKGAKIRGKVRSPSAA